MLYVFWTLPAFAVVASIATGRAKTLVASVIGVCVAMLIAFVSAPQQFQIAEAAYAVERGVWIGWIVVPYILGGLLFWRVAMDSESTNTDHGAAVESQLGQRRALFAACYLIGPFAESATGFGAGIFGTLVLVQRLGIGGIPLMVFSLLSQTMIMWGGMGSAAVLGAAFAQTDPTSLAVHTGMVLIALNVPWLFIFWRFADRAGLGSATSEKIREAGWLAGSFAAVMLATAVVGPETAMLIAYGPIIVLRYVADKRPTWAEMRTVSARMAPFAVLIVWLALTRLIPSLAGFLKSTGRIALFPGTPEWSPLFHAGTWLIVGAIATCVLRQRTYSLPRETSLAWKTGRLAILTIIMFSIMSEILRISGIADGLARAMYSGLGEAAFFITPLVSAVFGSLANTSSAANGLFMGSQIALATEAGLNLASAIALQAGAAMSLNIVAPVRIAMVCSLVGEPERERDLYKAMLPFVIVTAIVLVLATLMVVLKIV